MSGGLKMSSKEDLRSDRSATAVASPCIKRCALNLEGLCMGCFRSREEIGDWSCATAEQKLRIVQHAAQRAAKARQMA
tara:strand:- start:48230 stop:48463 length:234 start_codon:yes stop_codon:yes gene_type:complete